MRQIDQGEEESNIAEHSVRVKAFPFRGRIELLVRPAPLYNPDCQKEQKGK
jgi:hypothetical protein